MQNKTRNHNRDLLGQLQLDRWPAGHSLFLNLQSLRVAVQVTPAQADRIHLAANNLPLLRCLHIIGRDTVPLTRSSVESVLVDCLARNALVLTIQTRTVKMPLTFPNLQHLMLGLTRPLYGSCSSHEEVFPALRTLKGLKTLFVQSCCTFTILIKGATDLTSCMHLQHLTVQGVKFSGMLSLPAGCCLHSIVSCEKQGCYLYAVPGLNRNDTLETTEWGHDWPELFYPPGFYELKKLRLTMSKDSCNQENEKEKQQLTIEAFRLPALEVLELNLQNNRSVWIDPALSLTSLVVIAGGTLHLNIQEVCGIPVTTLKQMYVQAGNDFWPNYEKVQHAALAKKPNALPSVAIPRYAREKRGQMHWTARRPASFRPGSLQGCCCSACPECLERAGVPILCGQAWTSEGFAKHLRHHFSKEH